MRVNARFWLSSGVLALASRAAAQVASVCPETDVCFKLNIPESTASSGSGDIFFQISAPSSYEWAALGQGKAMSGSNIFAIYTSADGKNVTLSPRSGSGYNTPSFNGNAKVELLEGSGVSNGVMVANVKCSNCDSWSGGTADFTAGNGNWIYAYQSSGGPKNSDDQSASIRQHTGKSAFSWNYANAKGGSSVNPLVVAAPAGTGTGTGTGAGATSGGAGPAATCIPRQAQSAAASATANGGGNGSGNGASATQGNSSPTQTGSGDDDGSDGRDWRTYRPTARPTARPTGSWSGSGNDDDGGNSDDSNGRRYRRQNLPYCDESSSNDPTNAGFSPIMSGLSGDRKTMLIAHGVLASLAFVILFPAGAIAIRLASFPGVLWLHAAFQIFAYLIYTAAFGLGVYMAKEMNLLEHRHSGIGITVFAMILLQPLFGILHHKLYKKHGSRTLWSYIHIWLGRVAITLGMVNGGMGLQLADSMHMSSMGGIIAYGVIAVIMWLAWVAASVVGERRRKRELPPKYANRTDSDSDTPMQRVGA